MKKKILLTLTAMIIVMAITVSAISVATSVKTGDAFSCALKKKSDEVKFSDVTDDTVVLENSNIKFLLDCETAHFSVLDKKSGVTRLSAPDKIFSNVSSEDKDRVDSELTLTYYTKSDKKMYFSSNKLSRTKNTISVKQNSNTVRVIYSFGEIKSNTFIPSVFTKEEFENNILQKLQKTFDKRRISTYYHLYSPDSSEAAYKEIIDSNSSLKGQELYVITSNLNEMQKKEISDYLSMVDYTKEDYLNFTSKKSINAQILENESAGFSVTVEYALKNDGFSATILTDQIVENSSNFKLTTIDFLEYFSSVDEGEGYFFIPDGSGALIPINQNTSNTLRKPFYGNDCAMISSRTSQGITQSLILPVYGLSTEKGGYFAIVEGAAECATLQINTKGSSNIQNNAFCSFAVRDVEVADKSNPDGLAVNLYSKHFSYENPSIRYILMQEDNCDYSSMAQYYQSYLKENKVLSKNKSNKISTYIDFLCYYEKEYNTLGVKYNKDIALSTLKQISNIEEQLHNDIPNLTIRLKNYGNGGITNKINSKFDLSISVGTLNDLLVLSNKLSKNGGNLYLDQNFLSVGKDVSFDSYSQNKNSAKRLDKAVVSFGNFDTVTNLYLSNSYTEYYISPSCIPTYTDMFLKNYEKKVKENRPLISFSAAGTVLYSDFNSKNEFDRTMSKAAVRESLSKIKSFNGKTVTDGGYMYTYEYCDTVISLPSSSSLYDFESQSVPFVQMVLHGYSDYTLPALNTSNSFDENILRYAETGADLYLEWITESDDVLFDSPIGKSAYSLNYKKSISSLKEQYKKYSNDFSSLKKAKIVKNGFLDSEVKITEFDNETKVIVNYSQNDFIYNNAVIEAKSYKIIKE